MTAPVEVAAPGDKSITHRALLLAALADGESRLEGLLDAADTRSTAAALRGLGVDVPGGPLGRAAVRGVGLSGLRAPTDVLDCGNSGTTARLLLGVLAGCPFSAVLTGDASLRSRPMRRVTAPLAVAGARFEELEDGDRLPIRVTGHRPLTTIEHASPVASAQVKSALLLAGVVGGAAARVREPAASRDHTERMLRGMGADIEWRDTAEGRDVRLTPPERLTPLDLVVPGDISSAVPFLALGALLGPVRVTGVGLNPLRTGALRVLERMGAHVRVSVLEERGGEPVGEATVAPGELRGTTIEPHEVPGLLDEVPVLAAVAARATGETRFRGVAELRVKESDRVQALAQNLRALGVDVEETADELLVCGGKGDLEGRVSAHEDHRIAMAFAVLGAATGGRIEVEGRDVVSISYPGFWTELRRVIAELAS